MNKQDIIIRDLKEYKINGEKRKITINTKLKNNLNNCYKTKIDSNGNIIELEGIPMENILREVVYRKIYNQPGIFPDIILEFNNMISVVNDIK